MSNGKNYLLWSGVIVGSAQNIFKSIFCSLISIVIDNTNQLIFLFSPQRGLAVPPPQRRQRRLRRLRGRVRGDSGQEYFFLIFFWWLFFLRIFGWTGRRRGWFTNTRRKIGEGGGCLFEEKDCNFSLQIHILECGRTWLVNWKTRILGRWTTLAQK